MNNNIKFENNRFFKFGNNGYIAVSDETYKWDWCGLYIREPLKYMDLADINIGGLIGVREDSCMLWYTNKKYAYDDYGTGLSTVYSSSDGQIWTKEFETDKKVYVKNGKLYKE